MKVAKQFNFRIDEEHLTMLDSLRDLFEKNGAIDLDTGKRYSYNRILLFALETYYTDTRKILEDRYDKFVKNQSKETE